MLSGVLEGFYGRAWTEAQRLEMIDWIADAGMNVYAYAPKDDIKLRARWRELYTETELSSLKVLLDKGRSRGVDLMVAIAPCLDIVYSDPRELDALNARLDQLAGIGIGDFALLFDDIPNLLPDADRDHFSSFAAAQCHIANKTLEHLEGSGIDARLFFCPTEYCARFAGGDVKASRYLAELGERLAPEIEVFWTGPEIVSAEIPAHTLLELGGVLRREPFIWENFHANDYDIRRVHAGPLDGRGSDIRPLISGFITNPNNEFEANFVPVFTTGRLISDTHYDPKAALADAIKAWQPRFALAGSEQTLSLEEIGLLVDLFYQPFTLGPRSGALLADVEAVLAENRPEPNSAVFRSTSAALLEMRDEIRRLFDRFTELENRDLFYTFQPYLWEAREEMTHLASYFDWLATAPDEADFFPEGDRVHNFYRRGFAAAAQAILPRDRQGRLVHRT